MDANHTPIQEYGVYIEPAGPGHYRLSDTEIYLSKRNSWDRIVEKLGRVIDMGPREALAAEPIHINNFYYQDAQPVKDPKMPQMLRVAGFDHIRGEITSTAARHPVSFKSDDLLKLYRDPKVRSRLMHLSQKYGHDPKAIDYFINTRRKVTSLYVYFEGFVIVPDYGERKVYLWQIDKKMADELTSYAQYD